MPFLAGLNVCFIASSNVGFDNPGADHTSSLTCSGSSERWMKSAELRLMSEKWPSTDNHVVRYQLAVAPRISSNDSPKVFSRSVVNPLLHFAPGFMLRTGYSAGVAPGWWCWLPMTEKASGWRQSHSVAASSRMTIVKTYSIVLLERDDRWSISFSRVISWSDQVGLAPVAWHKKPFLATPAPAALHHGNVTRFDAFNPCASQDRNLHFF